MQEQDIIVEYCYSKKEIKSNNKKKLHEKNKEERTRTEKKKINERNDKKRRKKRSSSQKNYDRDTKTITINQLQKELIDDNYDYDQNNGDHNYDYNYDYYDEYERIIYGCGDDYDCMCDYCMFHAHFSILQGDEWVARTGSNNIRVDNEYYGLSESGEIFYHEYMRSKTKNSRY